MTEHNYYLYILKCCDGSYYIGHTSDIENRLGEHHSGYGGDYTSRRRPLRIVWADVFSNRSDAFEMERRIKNWSRKKKEALIRGDWHSLRIHAKKKFKKTNNENK